MSAPKEVAVGGTVYFWFAANTTAGTAGDGATPLYDVRKSGDSSSGAPTASGTPTLLTHANYTDGLHEIAIDTTGYTADAEYAVFCTLTISTVNPSGFCGSFIVRAASSLSYTFLTNVHTRLGTPSDLGGGATVAANLVTIESQTDDIGSAGAGLTALATQASVDVIDGIVDSILVDTAEIGVAGAGLTNINLPNQTMDIVGNITGNLSGSVGSVTGLTASNLDATISSRATPAQVNAEADTAIADAALATAANLATVAGYLDTEIAAILADTNELQTDWADGGRLDLVLDARASQTSVDDLPTNAELATALAAADDAVLAQVALVKAKTDSLTYTVAGKVDANITHVIADAIQASSSKTTNWGGT